MARLGTAHYEKILKVLVPVERSQGGEVHAGYVSVAGTDIVWISFKSKHDFVHVHSRLDLGLYSHPKE